MATSVFNHDTFPGPFNITSLLFLNDVQGEDGGGTRVWPESARKIRELADSDRVKYDKLWKLVKDVPALDLGEPIQLVPKRGDVLFWSHLLGHNVRPHPPVAPCPRSLLSRACACACAGDTEHGDGTAAVHALLLLVPSLLRSLAEVRGVGTLVPVRRGRPGAVR